MPVAFNWAGWALNQVDLYYHQDNWDLIELELDILNHFLFSGLEQANDDDDDGDDDYDLLLEKSG